MKPQIKEKLSSRKLMFAVFAWIVGTVYLFFINETTRYVEWIGFTEFILGSYFGANALSHGLNAFGKNYRNNEEIDNFNNSM